MGGVELHHNLPAALRISSNGLVLDGGLVVLASAGTPLRLGRYVGPDGGPPESAACEPDPLL
ncbi:MULTISPECIES: hypothetical protein [Synechococcales]|uniref:hypothetical protein n=1 Tax=Synechococcus sp. CS-1333 TaxID=2848638 RepID=UPI00223BBE19|nr:hypothetical protein [Synechococcus sp. CS-1333]MCT0209931.1 hypothetical protein [Synechococcus sp. CS-1333]